MTVSEVIFKLKEWQDKYGDLPVLLAQDHGFFATLDDTMSFGIYETATNKHHSIIIGPYHEDFSTPEEAMEEDV